MNMKLRLGIYKLPATSKGVEFTGKYVAAFKDGLSKLRNNKVDGLAVMAASHKNFYGEYVQWEIFKGIEPSPRLKGLFEEMGKRVKNGVVQIDVPEYEKVGSFYAHFNPIRGLRPVGVAKVENMPIDLPFPSNDPKVFHYGKVNPEEVFLLDKLDEKKIELLYNLFPFAPFHFLLVPDRSKGLPQSLEDPEQLKLGWNFLQRAGDPNLRLAFNSLGAYASAPHMHWQGFYSTELVHPPIDALINQASEGVTELAWPIRYTIVIKGETDDILKEANIKIQAIIAKAKDFPNTLAFNLYVGPDSVTIIPRKHQSALVGYINTYAPFTTGPAFFESIGIMIMPLRAYFDQTTKFPMVALSHFGLLYQFMSLEESPY